MNCVIQIPEGRFLSLIESEKLVPVIVRGFILYLADEWKKNNNPETAEDRGGVIDYIKMGFELNGINFDFQISFTNTYYMTAQFKYAGEYHFIKIYHHEYHI